MSSYTYRVLSPSCIRLLRLSPHEDESAPVQCRLFEYSLSPPRRGTHLYEALSYCWGSPTKSQTVFTEAGSLHVTENLYAALLRLRDPGLERVIWMDAICINQDDADEKGQQVQLMAEIYARASRVVVWLENITGDHLIDSESQADGHRALQALEAAAIAPTAITPHRRLRYMSGSSEPHDDENMEERLAVEKLFERPWFRRIWVLQEIAAARHILIICRSAEIDGQAFCVGFDQLNLFLGDSDSHMRAHSTISLMKGATIRSKCAVSGSGGFSLQISPLRHLVELYHVREATDRRDMVYALLGMSNDTPGGLVPDYRISWEDLFCQLVRSLLSKDASVTTYNEHATAVIKTKGCVLGKIRYQVEDEEYSFEPYYNQPGYYESPESRWESLKLQETAKHVEQGDLICFLQGASLPTIVRQHKDYCSIITIASDAEVNGTTISSPRLSSWRSKTQFEFLLVWEWRSCGKTATQLSTFNSFLDDRGLSCNNLEMPDDLNIAIMLLEAKQVALGLGKLLSLMTAYEDAGQSQHPKAVAATRRFDQTFPDYDLSIHRNDLTWDNEIELSYFVKKIRENVNVTEDLVIEAASIRSVDPIVFLLEACGHRINITENIIEAAARNSELVISLLFEHKKDKITVTENILLAAVGNESWSEEALKVLKCVLINGEGQIAITEAILVTATRNESPDSAVQLLEFLLECSGEQITITENILITAANNWFGGEIMQFLFERKRDQIVITENVLIAAAGGNIAVLDVLLKQDRAQITITENILMAAAASNSVHEASIIRLLLKQKGDQITVTEKIIKAARDPDSRALLLEHSRRNQDCRSSLPTSTKQNQGAFSG